MTIITCWLAVHMRSGGVAGDEPHLILFKMIDLFSTVQYWNALLLNECKAVPMFGTTEGWVSLGGGGR